MLFHSIIMSCIGMAHSAVRFTCSSSKAAQLQQVYGRIEIYPGHRPDADPWIEGSYPYPARVPFPFPFHPRPGSLSEKPCTHTYDCRQFSAVQAAEMRILNYYGLILLSRGRSHPVHVQVVDPSSSSQPCPVSPLSPYSYA